MPALNTNQRSAVWAKAMRETAGGFPITKPDLRAAVDAIDQWLADNASGLNAALPQPARSTLSSAQKARLLAAVALTRFEENA